MNTSESLVANGRSPNRVALVTGARIGGISCAVAQRLLQADWTVILGDRDREAGSAAMKMLVRQGCKRVCFSHCDFSEELQVAGLMDRIRRRFGKVDLLVNTSGSAGNPLDDNLANLTPAALKDLFRDNVVTFYNMTRAVVTQFMQHQATGGVVITLSTNNGILGIRGQMGYGALKQSLLSFCKALTVAYAAQESGFLSFRRASY